MLSWTVTFLILSVFSGILGFSGLAGTFASVAKISFYLFLAFFTIGIIRTKILKTNKGLL